MRQLLEHGANVNAQGGQFGNALQAASWGGQGGGRCRTLTMVARLTDFSIKLAIAPQPLAASVVTDRHYLTQRPERILIGEAPKVANAYNCLRASFGAASRAQRSDIPALGRPRNGFAWNRISAFVGAGKPGSSLLLAKIRSWMMYCMPAKKMVLLPRCSALLP